MKFRPSLSLIMMALALCAFIACQPATPDTPDPDPIEKPDPEPTPDPDPDPKPDPDPDPVTDPGAPAAYGALPTEGQVEWQKQEQIMFFHFGPTTFSGYDGDRANHSANDLVNYYKPTGLDCDQWVKTAADNGFKGVILTVKHHDGFCLWDNPASDCDVAACTGYETDVLAEVAKACKKYGINLGIYMSPWDKVTTGDYQKKYLEAIESLLSGTYGKVNEFWLDGHNAGKAGISFKTVNEKILSYNENTVIFSNVGPGCRWVGNEDGEAGETNWSTFSPSDAGATQSDLPGSYWDYLSRGNEGGKSWIPAETDLSIRPIGDNNGWFWGSSEKPKTAKDLMKAYYTSTGRNSIMLLNVPPTTAGVIDSKDIESLKGFNDMREAIFGTNLADGATASCDRTRGNNNDLYGPQHMIDGDYDTYFATNDDKKTCEIVFELKEKTTFNRVVLQEYIPLGQRVKSFSIMYMDDSGSWKTLTSATTIGYKRILLTKSCTTTAVKVKISSSLAIPVLNGFGLYNDTVSGF